MASIIKQSMLEEITKEFEKNPYAFISSFDALPVADLFELRRSLEKVSKRSMVIKHTIAKRAFETLQLQGAEKFFRGQILVTVGDKDPQAISKTLVDFAKTNNKFSPQGVVFERKLYDQGFVKSLAQLPSRQELLTQVVVRVKSPISGFVSVLGQLVRGFVVALNEVKKKKEAASA